MRSDSYRTYIETLNASEAYPPFQEIRALVMQQNGRRKAAFIPFYKYAAVAALFAMLGMFVGNHFFTKESLPYTQTTHPSHESYASHVTDGLTMTKVTTNKAAGNIVRLNESPKNTFENESQAKPTLANVDQTNVPSVNAALPHSTEAPNPPSSNTQAITTPTATSAPTTLAQLSNQHETIVNHWTAFLSGGSFVPSNNFTASSIFGAAGVRYQILGSSSIVVELRRSAFLVNHAGQTGVPTDTMVTVGGQATQLTLGGASLPATTSTSQINSLDVGYRFDLNPNDGLSPCAEILAGASISGFLSSEAAGIEYRFANSLLFDVSARAEQLFSPASVPLSALGFEAGIGFVW